MIVWCHFMINCNLVDNIKRYVVNDRSLTTGVPTSGIYIWIDSESHELSPNSLLSHCNSHIIITSSIFSWPILSLPITANK